MTTITKSDVVAAAVDWLEGLGGGWLTARTGAK